MIVSSFCFALKSVIVNILAVWWWAQCRGRALLASPGVGRLHAEPSVAATASRRVRVLPSHAQGYTLLPLSPCPTL
jgi:hypothetical protein